MRLRLIAGVITFALVQAASALIGYFGQKPAPINIQPTAPPGWEHKLSVQIVGCRVSADGKVTETILGSPTIKTLDGIQASLQMKVGRIPESTISGASEINLGLLPKRTESGSILLTAYMKMYVKAQKQNNAPLELKLKVERNRLKLSAGQKVRVLGMTSDPDATLQSWVLSGKIAKSNHEYAAYFLDVTDVVTGRMKGKDKQPN